MIDTPSRRYLDCHWIDSGLYFEGALLEHHHSRIINASTLGKNQYGKIVEVIDMFTKTPGDQLAVLDLESFEPNVIGGPVECGLEDAEKSALSLAN